MKSLTQTMSASTAFSGAVLILAVIGLVLLVNAFALYMYADANHE